MSTVRGWRRGGLRAAGVVAAVAVFVAVLAGVPASTAAPGDVTFALLDTWPLPQAPAEPVDVALLSRDRLFVADGRDNAILVYDDAGAVVAEWDDPPTGPLTGHAYVPVALAADLDRDLVYVLWQRYREDPGGLTAGGLFLDARRADGGAVRPLQALTFLSSATDLAVDPPSGDLWFRTGEAVTRLTVPGGVPLSGFHVGPDAGRLAVSRDGTVAVTRPAAGAVERFNAAGVSLGRTPLARMTPLDLVGDGGGWRVLVRAAVSADPGAPLVVRLDASGAVAETLGAGDIMAPVPPAGAWPWAIAWSPDGAALTSGATRFQVHRFDQGGGAVRPMYGGPVRTAFTPHSEDARLIAASLSLAPLADGSLAVLDARAAQVYRFDRVGAVSQVATAPEHAVDLAADASGTFFVTTADGRMMRLPPGGGPPVWDVPCACSLGGRLTAAPATVYVTRPREHVVSGLDPATGAEIASLHLTDGVGLWPSDIVADPFGRLYTADLVTARVQTWTDPELPSDVWQTGLLSGPRRLALGRLADGTPVLAAIMADGVVELHGTADGNLVGRWEPTLPDGTVPDLADLTMGPDGELYVADARARVVHVFGPGGGIPETPEPTAGVSPTPSDLACTVRGSKIAAPDTVVLGDTAAVTLTLSADCPSRTRLIGADIVLVIDRSGSMLGAKMEAAKGAARAFAELLDVRHHRLGLASFSTDASIDVPLTDSVPAVIDGLAVLNADGGTNIAAALDRARANLESFGRAEALPVIVLLSDGLNNEHQVDPRPVAAAARNWGAQIYTIGLGDDVDAAILRDIAGRPEGYYFAPSPSELFPIYGEILRAVVSSLAGNLVIDDLLGDGFRYVAGSARPLALESSTRLRWGRSILPSSGLTLTYRIRPEADGCRPTNRHAVADYTDADGARRQHVFPVPTVCVITPTVVPSATPSPTPTPVPPTPTPVRLALPALLRHACVPVIAHADVVLLLDTSGSMEGTKLTAAKVAATMFLAYLDFPRDRAAVIGFDGAARLVRGLTDDTDALERAILSLANGSGTRIDLGLSAALSELRSDRRLPANRGVVVLLSDGGHVGDRADVLDVAADLRALDALVFAIGLGEDADGALLAAVAGAPGRFYYAPDERALAEIYRSIAVTIPCGR